MEATQSKWTVVSKGTTVRVTRAWRTPTEVGGPNAFKEWVDFPAGMVGVVDGITNAGFRGQEHSVVFPGQVGPDGRPLRANHLGACHLEVL